MQATVKLPAPAASPSRKEPQYPLNMRLDGPWGKSGNFGKEKNLKPLPEFKLLTVQPQPACYTKYAILAPNRTFKTGLF